MMLPAPACTGSADYATIVIALVSTKGGLEMTVHLSPTLRYVREHQKVIKQTVPVEWKMRCMIQDSSEMIRYDMVVVIFMLTL